MMLHGVDNPHIVYQDSLSQNNTERDKYTLIMANPPFTGKLFKNQVSGDLLALTQTGKTELLFVSLFTKMLQIGGRCASIVLREHARAVLRRRRHLHTHIRG